MNTSPVLAHEKASKTISSSYEHFSASPWQCTDPGASVTGSAKNMFQGNVHRLQQHLHIQELERKQNRLFCSIPDSC